MESEMKSPAELAAWRIMARISGYLPMDAPRKQLVDEIREVIEEELKGHLREDHHGPKQGTYMRRALKAQKL